MNPGDGLRAAMAGLLLSLVPSLAGPLPNVEFRVEGEVAYHNYLAEPQHQPPGLNFTPIVDQTHRFSLAVSNRCWWMRVTRVGRSAFLFREAAFDGQTLFCLSELVGGSDDSELRQAHIYDRQQVLYDNFNHEMGPVWLMFASGAYFAGLTNDLVEPATILGLFELQEFYKKPFLQQAKWSLQRKYPFVPTAVDYLDDGEVKTDPEFQPHKRPSPFDQGYTNVAYRVLSFTNIAEMEVPLVGQLDTFRSFPYKEPGLTHFTRYRVKLTGWSKGAGGAQFPPALPGKTQISDTRAYPILRRSLTYIRDYWPTWEQVQRMPEMESRRASREKLVR